MLRIFPKTQFVLTSFLVHKYRKEDSYPVIQRVKGSQGYFPSIAHAEKAIRSLVEKYANHPGRAPYAFLLNEVPFDLAYKPVTINERLYDATGNLIDTTLCTGWSEVGVNKFPRKLPPYTGRKDEQIRFKRGTLVEHLDPVLGTSELMIVVRRPDTREKVESEKVKGLLPPPVLPLSDMYLCAPLDGKTERPCYATRLLEPTLPITDALKAEIKKDFSNK